MTRKIIDAKAGKDGNINQVKIEGNTNYTSIDKAIKMADKGAFSNAHSVHPSETKSYLRTNPNNAVKDNLDDLAGDK